MTAEPDRLRMLTFAPMVDSETTRLICRHFGLDVEEQDHLFGWVSILAKLHGGTGFIPLVYGQGLTLTGPAQVVQHFDPLQPPECRLFQAGQPLANQVAADWKTYNGEMGADIAVFSYFHLLPERALMAPIFAQPVPPIEAALVPLVYGLLSMLFTKLLKLSPERASEAADRMRRTFDATDKRIADGRRFLCGDKLTMGDIALSAASAPALLPRGYGALMPALDELPPVMRAFSEELRAHPTAAFVQNLYDSGFTGT